MVASAAVAATMMVVVPTDAVETSTHPRGGCSAVEGGDERKRRGRNSFADDPAMCRIDWQLWPSDDIYFVVALSIFLPSSRCLGALPFQCRRRNNLLLGQPSRPCRPRSLFSSRFFVAEAKILLCVNLVTSALNLFSKRFIISQNVDMI